MASLEPIDDSFLRTAPHRYARSWAIDRPATSVWQELTGDSPLHWVRGLQLNWTSPRPFGVGSTRHMKVFGLIEGEEYFHVWEEGRRAGFYLREANVPLFQQFGEDYVVEPLGESRSLLTWRIAVAPTPLGAPGIVLNTLLFASMFHDTGRHFGV